MLHWQRYQRCTKSIRKMLTWRKRLQQQRVSRDGKKNSEDRSKRSVTRHTVNREINEKENQFQACWTDAAALFCAISNTSIILYFIELLTQFWNNFIQGYYYSDDLSFGPDSVWKSPKKVLFYNTLSFIVAIWQHPCVLLNMHHFWVKNYKWDFFGGFQNSVQWAKYFSRSY